MKQIDKPIENINLNLCESCIHRILKDKVYVCNLNIPYFPNPVFCNHHIEK